MNVVIDWSSSTPIIVMGWKFYLSYATSRYIHDEGEYEIGQFLNLLKYPLYPENGIIVKVDGGEFQVVKDSSTSDMMRELIMTEEYRKFMDLLHYYDIKALTNPLE